MDYKFKIGQKVRVRPDLIAFDKNYYMKSGPNPHVADIVTNEMIRYCGEEITIEDINRNGSGRYLAKTWFWTDEMFEDYSKPFVCKSLL